MLWELSVVEQRYRAVLEVQATARPVCRAFVEAMKTYGHEIMVTRRRRPTVTGPRRTGSSSCLERATGEPNRR
jgi:hypothetical protein